MRVVEVIIDGFKSYAVRTVISGWDETFNSITGLNGSGKSNILDAICFVLGITNMTTVRAQNLQDLIYKRGQAGVTKASVTIVFDNRDKKKSPIGFEEYAQISVTRQIVLGGTSKYLINGHRAQQHTVQNLFQSVQLNINNPNFLIMQGRITKVLNMKPQEILAMIEEAAGTRMFEDRKDKAFKTMTKKEMKVQEITSLLKEEIDPKLEKLRQEKRAFLDFQQTQNDLERLTKLVVAYDYFRSKDRAKDVVEELEARHREMKALEDLSGQLQNEIAFLHEDLDKVKGARDRELKKGGKFQALEDQAREYANEIARLATVLDLRTGGLTEEKTRKSSLEKQLQDLRRQLQAKTTAHKDAQQRFEAAKADLKKQTAEVETKEELLQTLQTGISSRDGQASGYQGQLHESQGRASAAATEQEQLKLKITHLESRIKEEEPRAKKARQENAALLKSLETLRSQASRIELELSKAGYVPGKEEAQRKREAEITREIRHLQDEADNLSRKVANLDFSYSDPVPNFNRAKVKGLVAQLLSVDEARFNVATALEICAGGRLYNVVVDSADTGSQLLKNGKLKKRVTIIPLNKISPYTASSDKIKAAQRIAPGKVDLALSLIGYDDDITAAMEFVFGSTFICADADTAKKVTFDPSVRMKSVTLEGDVYDPSGTLSGGSAPQSSGVLLKVQKLNELNQRIRDLSTELTALQTDIANDKVKLEKTRKLKQELDLKTHEISLAGQQLSSNSASSIIEAVEQMREDIKNAKAEIEEAKARQDAANKDAKKVEKDMSEFNKNKNGKLAELQQDLVDLKQSLKSNSESLKPLQQALREAQLDSEQTASDVDTTQESLQECEQSVQTMQKDLNEIKLQQSSLQESHDEAQAALDDERTKLTGYDTEIKSLEEAVRSKNTQISDNTLTHKNLTHAIEKLAKERTNASQIATNLEQEHDWIAEEASQFGKPNTPYDFRKENMSECKSSLRNVTERFQGMKKKINPKVMNMIDSVEKKEVALKNMMKTVIRDKKKIEETVETLDEYKKEALERTWSKVNGDFGQIFEMLLPGSFAKLDPLEGKSIAEGLEVKVCLGKVWKQSLTELSGGQRSLIALSLIMALLQFKPAPMYILDEVDAALDLSHTQNIGRLIKTRFKGSQFIVVSLKDGMFANANRIFKTRFSEGTSMVQALTPADMK